MTKHKRSTNQKFCRECGGLKELFMFGQFGKNKICTYCLDKKREERQRRREERMQKNNGGVHNGKTKGEIEA